MVKSDETLATTLQIARRALREWAHITERRRAEEALRETEEHLRLALAAARMGWSDLDIRVAPC